MKAILLTIIIAATWSLSANSLYGKIYDESTLEPIQGATVTVSRHKTTSNEEGLYNLGRLSSGLIIIMVRSEGYVPFSTSITLDERKVRYDIPLKSTRPAKNIRPLFIEDRPSKIESPTRPESPSVPVVTPVSPAKEEVKLTPETQTNDKPKTPFLENLPQEPPPIADGFKETLVFDKGKKLLDEGNFIKAIPLFYQVMSSGSDNVLKMKAAYYTAIIFKNQNKNELALDYLYKTLSMAYLNDEEKAFINQLKSEIAHAYAITGSKAFAKPLIDAIVKEENVNFPITNFNCYQFLIEWYTDKGNSRQVSNYLAKAMKCEVSPQLKSKPYLTAIDIHIRREELREAEKLLASLKNFYQSEESEKRNLLIEALSKHQSLLSSGNLDAVRARVIPILEKAISLDPEYADAYSYLVNIEFSTGKLTKNLQLVLNAKKNVRKLINIDSEVKDPSGMKPLEILEEINAYLASF